MGVTKSNKLELLRSGLLKDNGKRFLHDSLRDYYCGKYFYHQLYKKENESIENLFKKYIQYEFFEEPLKFFITLFCLKEQDNIKNLNKISDLIIKYLNLLPIFFTDVISYCGKLITDQIKSGIVDFLKNLLFENIYIYKIIFINTIKKLSNIFEIKLTNELLPKEFIVTENKKIFLHINLIINFLSVDLSLNYRMKEFLLCLDKKNILNNILPFLNNSNSLVRTAVIEVISKLGTNDNIKDILPMFKDDSGLVRAAAIKAFYKLGTNDNIKDILDLSKDGNSWIRAVAIEAL